MNAKQMSALMNKIIKLHGPVIDLRKSPEVLIEIVRGFGADLAANDNPCGGTPPAPVPPPPAPSPAPMPPAINDEIILAIRGLTKEINSLAKSVAVMAQR